MHGARAGKRVNWGKTSSIFKVSCRRCPQDTDLLPAGGLPGWGIAPVDRACEQTRVWTLEIAPKHGGACMCRYAKRISLCIKHHFGIQEMRLLDFNQPSPHDISTRVRISHTKWRQALRPNLPMPTKMSHLHCTGPVHAGV